ncbi:hypothetical protein [Falsirhodobacter sp. 20TX0035]|nr:hypothetical protein [Falsirhodobacter sp. 20TX0035]MDB6455001.1 hypothetical protein [Falsirhodobacter sp. 20TX0035]
MDSRSLISAAHQIGDMAVRLHDLHASLSWLGKLRVWWRGYL